MERHHLFFTLHDSLHNQMNKLYIFHAMNKFGKGIIGIFIPVFLYKIGFPIHQILLYYIGISIGYFLLFPQGVKLINKIGFKYSILLSIPFFLLNIIILNYVKESPWLLFLALLGFAIHGTTFWPAYHSEVAMRGNKKKRASEVGILQMITTFFGALAPLIGGFILETSSYTVLLIISMIILLLGSLPLLFSEDIKVPMYKMRYKDYLRFIKSRNDSWKAFFSQGVEHNVLGMILWPLILFILLKENFLKLGTLLTVVSLVSIVAIMYIKNYMDTKDKNSILKNISKFLSVNWFLKFFILFFGSIFLYIVESTFTLLQDFFNLSFVSIFYNNAQKGNYMDYILYRETYVHTGRIVFSLLAIPIFFFFNNNLITLLVVVLGGALSSWGMSFLKEEHF